MNIQPINNESAYENALKEIDRLFQAKPNTPQGDKLDVLATLVAAYEEKHEPIGFPDPVIALKYYMETRSLTRKDLESCLGSRARVSEVLNKKRSLSLNMIRNLKAKYHIPPEALVG